MEKTSKKVDKHYFSKENLHEKLIPYAFFESVRIGADFTPFLADDLPMSPEDVRSFLGAFLHVLPCDDTTDCLLVYKKSERLYDVRKCSVNLKDGKITDIFA